jgi:hypothetical protein
MFHYDDSSPPPCPTCGAFMMLAYVVVKAASFPELRTFRCRPVASCERLSRRNHYRAQELRSLPLGPQRDLSRIKFKPSMHSASLCAGRASSAAC